MSNFLKVTQLLSLGSTHLTLFGGRIGMERAQRGGKGVVIIARDERDLD